MRGVWENACARWSTSPPRATALLNAMDPDLVMLRERVLAAKAARAPLQLRGAGTKDFYGESINGELLDVSGYRGVIDYEPSELVITARCGTPLTEIETALAERGQFLAFEPPRFGGDPTLGG